MDKYKKAGFKLLLNHIKKKYPFVIEITPNISSLENYGTLMTIEVKFDLNKFYKFTNTTFPKSYKESEYLMDLLKNDGYYLMRYVDDEYEKDFGSGYNDAFINHMNSYYSRLPEYMRYYQFEGWSDEMLTNKLNNLSLDSGKRWQEEKNPISLSINKWIPEVDLDKLKEMN